MAARTSAPSIGARHDPMLAALSQVRRRKPEHSERTRELRRRILDGGRAQFHALGYVDCGLRGLAEEVDTRAQTIMRLFGSKHGLLRCIFDESFETALGWLEEIDVDEPEDALVTGVLLVLERADDDPRVGDFLIANDLLLGAGGGAPPPAHEPLDAERTFNRWFLERARGCAGSGIEPLALAEACVGIMERFLLNAYLRRSRRGAYPLAVDRDTVEEVLRLLLATGAHADRSRGRERAFAHVDRLEGWEDGVRDRLVASAWVEFATHGYGTTTTAAIARGARTSEAELSRQCRHGKFELLREVHERAYAFVLADLEALDAEDDAGSALLDGAELLWWLGRRQPTLTKFLVFDSGCASSLLIMPREAMTEDDRTALTDGAERYFLWFTEQARRACPPGVRPELGVAVGEAVLGVAERVLLTWHRDQLQGRRRMPRPQDAIVPLERIVSGLQGMAAHGEPPRRRVPTAA